MITLASNASWQVRSHTTQLLQTASAGGAPIELFVALAEALPAVLKEVCLPFSMTIIQLIPFFSAISSRTCSILSSQLSATNRRKGRLTTSPLHS